ncbi:MAG: hypothetical protein A7316_07535 [Candidatus Altiarchaeales archaeon WOR_SM1_86-2]|nr:MAG: hypothetical protein A7316_07535 [Candidatus Altiarchaeales archaeon WOR_SM1_86-2]ODS38782.1 MAG: hypothetical protein A7315_03205 [Candidatus Altiarchaeales archaeon WOR_SM1_79]
MDIDKVLGDAIESKDIKTLIETASSKAMNDPKLAEKIFKKILEMDPNNVKVHHNFGILLYMAGRYKDAEKEFREAIKISLEKADAHYDRGFYCARHISMGMQKKSLKKR